MKAILTVGLPASGKSTWANEYSKENDYYNLERDLIRPRVYSNFPDYTPSRKAENQVTEMFNEELENFIKSGVNFIISDTNLNKQFLHPLVSKLENNGYDVEFKYFTDVPLKELLKRNRFRIKSVPEDVIHRMAKSRPDLFDWAKKEYSLVDKPYVEDDSKQDCIIIDLDGTVADMEGVRGPYEQDRVLEDKPHQHVIDMILRTQQQGGNMPKLVFFTARENIGSCYEDTKKWLETHFPKRKLYFDFDLYMRKPGDHRKDNIVKEEMFWEWVAPKYNPSMVFDDRRQVVEMWKNLFIGTDVQIFQIHHPGKDDNF